MQFEFLYGDILEQDVEAIVIPAKARGMFKMRLHQRISPGWGNGTKARRAIMVHFYEDDFQGAQIDKQILLHRECLLYICYLDVLDCAKELGVRSIAFSLFGIRYLRVPEVRAREIGESAVSNWLNTHENHFDKVYFVIPSPKTLGYINPIESDAETLIIPHYIMEYEQRLEKSIEQSGLDIKEFKIQKCREYLRGIDKPSKLAKDLGFGPEVITRFKNKLDNLKHGHIPHKKRVIAMAIGMGLSDYQRYEFIRCSGYDYPSEKLDILVEAIIQSGVKKFEIINEMLCEKSPDNDLSAPLKKETEK